MGGVRTEDGERGSLFDRQLRIGASKQQLRLKRASLVTSTGESQQI
jgi:hypothetical protein